jgi:hypothetical protein
MAPLQSVFDEYHVTTRDLMVSLALSNWAVRKWFNGENPPSTKHARLIEERFGIPRHLLRPDVWDPPPERTNRKAEPAI